MSSQLQVKSIKEKNTLEYLKGYAIQYLDKSNQLREWELVSRQGLHRLKSEIEDLKSYTDGVMIFATNEEKSKVVLLKEYRVSAGKYVYTLPAGLIDAKESINKSAIREFKEETGLDFKLVKLDKERYTSVGIINEKVNIAYGYYSGTPSKKFQEDSEDAEIIIADKKFTREILENEEVTIRTALLLKDFYRLNTFFK